MQIWWNLSLFLICTGLNLTAAPLPRKRVEMSSLPYDPQLYAWARQLQKIRKIQEYMGYIGHTQRKFAQQNHVIFVIKWYCKSEAYLLGKLIVWSLTTWNWMGLSFMQYLRRISMVRTRVDRDGLFSWNKSPPRSRKSTWSHSHRHWRLISRSLMINGFPDLWIKHGRQTVLSAKKRDEGPKPGAVRRSNISLRRRWRSHNDESHRSLDSQHGNQSPPECAECQCLPPCTEKKSSKP